MDASIDVKRAMYAVLSMLDTGGPLKNFKYLIALIRKYMVIWRKMHGLYGSAIAKTQKNRKVNLGFI